MSLFTNDKCSIIIYMGYEMVLFKLSAPRKEKNNMSCPSCGDKDYYDNNVNEVSLIQWRRKK